MAAFTFEKLYQVTGKVLLRSKDRVLQRSKIHTDLSKRMSDTRFEGETQQGMMARPTNQPTEGSQVLFRQKALAISASKCQRGAKNVCIN